MRSKKYLSVFVAVLAFGTNAMAHNKHTVKVKPIVPLEAEYFDLSDVRVTSGVFKNAMDVNADWLLDMDCDRLLSNFFKNAGLEPMGESYGGWEMAGIAGHTLGHYLTAVSQQYASSGDQRFADKANYLVERLDSCQIAFVNGFIGGMPGGDRVFKQVKKGVIKSKGFDLNGLWVPWYNLHKTMMGLSDAYLLVGNEKALKVLTEVADYTLDINRDLTPEQIQEMLNCEFGGMNEALAQVYALTGDKKYLEASWKYFDHKRISDPLSRKEDVLPGLHSNTQIPKIIGNALQYELSGSKRDSTIAAFFWETMVNNHSYANGGNSAGEYLAAAGRLNDRLTESTCETCNTYNMLKLTKHLFDWTGDAKYIDYYERALYNHILASQNPQTGMTCYFVPLAMGAKKSFCDKIHSFSCCMGSGFENHSKYGGAIYAKDKENNLIVNLYIPSELNWEERCMKVKLTTNYPAEGKAIIKMEGQKPQKFGVKVRYPYWATNGFVVKVNGRKQPIQSAPGSFVTINRQWKSGDKIEIDMPMSLHTMAMPDNADRRAVFFGPTLLAGDLGMTEIEPVRGVPVLVSEDKEVVKYIKSTKETLRFETVRLGVPKDVTLKPFYDTYDNYYTVYWDVFSPSEWKDKQAEYEAERQRIAALDKKTVDYIRFGEMQPERDHNLDSENSRIGDFQGRKYRFAYEDGWFEFDMKVDQTKPMEMLMTFWGGDSGKNIFEVVFDGKEVVKVKPESSVDNKFFETVIAIPTSVVTGKNNIKVRFRGTENPRNRVTNLYDVRSMIKD